MRLTVDSVRPCLEGGIPGVMATASAEGEPNVAYLSQVEYVDARHVALSFQFFNKTRRNVLANPQVELLVVHPVTAAMYRLRARYLRTESEGPLFERMKAKLAGVASHVGMAEVFRLRGSDVYEVLAVEPVGAPTLPDPPPGLNRLAALRRTLQALMPAQTLESLFDTLLDALQREFAVDHAMVLMHEGERQCLATVASRGYGASGVGAEIPMGQGVIGVAARARTPIRIGHLTQDRAYNQTIREALVREGGQPLEDEIPWPGLAQPHSQLAVPICDGGELLGVLFVESTQDQRFTSDDEDALLALAAHVGALQRHLQSRADEPEPVEPGSAEPAVVPAGPSRPHEPQGEPLRVRHFAADGSVFLDDQYLIRGLAGAILWLLLQTHVQEGRTDFSNRELRLAPSLRLPEVGDNLEARLLMLTRRLEERCDGLRLVRTGRGRFRLCVLRPLSLTEQA